MLRPKYSSLNGVVCLGIRGIKESVEKVFLNMCKMELSSFVKKLPLSWFWKPCQHQRIHGGFTLIFPMPFFIACKGGTSLCELGDERTTLYYSEGKPDVFVDQSLQERIEASQMAEAAW